MEFNKQDFELFQREVFSFKQLKQNCSEEEIEQLKQSYKTVWDKWKAINTASYGLLPTNDLAKPKVESWTNGWNLRNHFWCALRSTSRKEQAACLAVLLNKKNLQIYLMYQHYKSDERYLSKKEYNKLLDRLPEWSLTVNPANYVIWSNEESELAEHLPLVDYLENPEVQTAFRQQISATTFQLGVQLPAGDIVDAEKKIAAFLTELDELYQKL